MTIIMKKDIPVETMRKGSPVEAAVAADVYKRQPKKRFNTAEHLVHTTKKNQARFDFDLRFPKMPSYLRRAAIQHALGSVSSYKTRMELWKKTDQKGGRPKLVCDNHARCV